MKERIQTEDDEGNSFSNMHHFTLRSESQSQVLTGLMSCQGTLEDIKQKENKNKKSLK